MEYRNLGRSGLKTSVLTLGTMNFDGEGFFNMPGSVDRKQASRLLDIAIEAGVNMFDTSNAYTRGKSEAALGELLKGRSADLMVTTKVRFPMGEGPNNQGLSRRHIIEQCEASLRRLQRNHIDMYLMHQWDGQTPIEETMDALGSLVRDGKVRYIGCSNFSGWHIMKALMAADKAGTARLTCQQIHYTIEAREAEMELVPVSIDQGLGIQVWSPIAGGLLSGKFRRNASPEQSRHLSGWTEPPIYDQERLWRIVDALVEVGQARNVSAAQVALAWLCGKPGVSSLVIGARNETQLKDNLASASLKLTAEDLHKLEQVSHKPLPYPYWHQFNAVSDRLGPADLSLLQPHIDRRGK
jgi:aryl-alcohol dehydrogenase-like predicted oxidoreductase